jgi:ribosomal protein L16/L10AE
LADRLRGHPHRRYVGELVSRDERQMREYRVVQITTYYVRATDKDDAQDRVSDGMGDLSGTEYRVAVVQPGSALTQVRTPSRGLTA